MSTGSSAAATVFGRIRRGPSPGAAATTMATLLLTLTACGSGGDAEPPEMTEGEALFVANCAECHGARALGDGPLAPSLPVQPPSLMEHLGHHPQDQLVRIIRTGVPPAMPPAPLTDDEVLLVIDYAWTLVPDSLVEGLREMQRMAEMGMQMNMTDMPTDPDQTADTTGR